LADSDLADLNKSATLLYIVGSDTSRSTVCTCRAGGTVGEPRPFRRTTKDAGRPPPLEHSLFPPLAPSNLQAN